MGYLNDFRRMAIGRDLPKLNEGVEHDDFSRALVNGVRAARGQKAEAKGEPLPPDAAKEFLSLANQMSPENLFADGERPKAQAMKLLKALKARWKELEKKVGRKVTEDEVWGSVSSGGRMWGEARLVEADDMEIAKTIAMQMGGKMKAMLGATLSTVPNGLKIKWPQKKRSLGNVCVVTLRPDDTYDMEFFNGDKSVKKFEGIYAEALKPTFEKHTGWYLTL